MDRVNYKYDNRFYNNGYSFVNTFPFYSLSIY